MRRSNTKVKKWLIDNGYSCVYFMPHIRYPYEQLVDGERIIGLDIFNLFDGIALGKDLIFFQVSTNGFHKLQPYVDFCSKYDISAILFNVVDRKGIKTKRITGIIA
jgi:hypothetical protein